MTYVLNEAKKLVAQLAIQAAAIQSARTDLSRWERETARTQRQLEEATAAYKETEGKLAKLAEDKPPGMDVIELSALVLGNVLSETKLREIAGLPRNGVAVQEGG